jgi:peptide/nickel transport system permease protein
MLIGTVVVLVAGTVGIVLGSLAGYFGGAVDMFIMRFGEAIGSLPFLPIALIIMWRFGHLFGPIGGMVFLMFVLGLLTWPGLMRLVRGQFLQARESEYVTAARTLGVGQMKIIFKHIFPNIASIVIVWLTLTLAGSMLIETGLSFIGFGVSEPTPTWGNMLSGANNSLVLREQWWRWVFPAVALVTTALSINLIGDGLREATDPRARGR